MSHTAERFFAKAAPFLGLGVFLALFIIGMVIFSYIIIIGAVIGLVLFVINYIRTKFSSTKKTHLSNHQNRGRTIDHDG